MFGIFGDERRIAVGTLAIGVLIGLSLVFLTSCATGASDQPVQVSVPQVSVSQAAECPTCTNIQVTKCFKNTVGLVLLLYIEGEDGGGQVIPAPILEEGCRCIAVVEGISTITMGTIPDHICDEWFKQNTKEVEPKGENTGTKL